MVQRLSEEQRLAVMDIGLGGLLDLECTILIYPLCMWLVSKFDLDTSSLWVYGQTFLLTESHVHECLGINAQGNPLEVNMSEGFSETSLEPRSQESGSKTDGVERVFGEHKGRLCSFHEEICIVHIGIFFVPHHKVGRESIIYSRY